MNPISPDQERIIDLEDQLAAMTAERDDWKRLANAIVTHWETCKRGIATTGRNPPPAGQPGGATQEGSQNVRTAAGYLTIRQPAPKL